MKQWLLSLTRDLYLDRSFRMDRRNILRGLKNLSGVVVDTTEDTYYPTDEPTEWRWHSYTWTPRTRRSTFPTIIMRKENWLWTFSMARGEVSEGETGYPKAFGGRDHSGIRTGVGRWWERTSSHTFSVPSPRSIAVAGPSTLAKSVRAALCSDYAWPSSVLRGVPAVSLHVETFGTVNA